MCKVKQLNHLNYGRKKTIVHEAKHAQSNICEHFGIREDGEAAAELIAYIVQKMWEDFEILLKVNYNE